MTVERFGALKYYIKRIKTGFNALPISFIIILNLDTPRRRV